MQENIKFYESFFWNSTLGLQIIKDNPYMHNERIIEWYPNNNKIYFYYFRPIKTSEFKKLTVSINHSRGSMSNLQLSSFQSGISLGIER